MQNNVFHLEKKRLQPGSIIISTGFSFYRRTVIGMINALRKVDLKMVIIYRMTVLDKKSHQYRNVRERRRGVSKYNEHSFYNIIGSSGSLVADKAPREISQ